MFTIWISIGDSWELVEALHDHENVIERLSELRQDGEIYRAEKRDGLFSTILED